MGGRLAGMRGWDDIPGHDIVGDWRRGDTGGGVGLHALREDEGQHPAAEMMGMEGRRDAP